MRSRQVQDEIIVLSAEEDGLSNLNSPSQTLSPFQGWSCDRCSPGSWGLCWKGKRINSSPCAQFINSGSVVFSNTTCCCERTKSNCSSASPAAEWTARPWDSELTPCQTTVTKETVVNKWLFTWFCPHQNSPHPSPGWWQRQCWDWERD